MLILAKILLNIFSVLNSEVSPRQIAAGFAWGVMIGLLPIHGLLPYVFLAMAFVININLAAMGFSAAIFKVISFVIDPLANFFGYVLLTSGPLRPFWTRLMNTPVLPYTRFNNTLVLGSLIVGLIFLVPFYWLSKSFVLNYRTRYRDHILRWRIVQILKTSKIFEYYQTFQRMKGS